MIDSWSPWLILSLFLSFYFFFFFLPSWVLIVWYIPGWQFDPSFYPLLLFFCFPFLSLIFLLFLSFLFSFFPFLTFSFLLLLYLCLSFSSLFSIQTSSVLHCVTKSNHDPLSQIFSLSNFLHSLFLSLIVRNRERRERKERILRWLCLSLFTLFESRDTVF